MSAMLRGNIRMALSGVRSSRWRSFLTMLGIIVGIVSVVTVVGIGEGVKRQVAGTVDHFGKDVIVIRPAADKKVPFGLGRADVLFGMASNNRLTDEDADVVAKTPGVVKSAPLGVVSGTIEVDDTSSQDVPVLAVGADSAEVLNQHLRYGDFWDKDTDALFAVVGRHAAQQLFGEPAPLGKSFVFRGETFLVRGVFDRFPEVPFSPTAGFDDVVFIPYKTASRLTHNATGPYVILAKAEAQGGLRDTVALVDQRLMEAHGGEHDVAVSAATDRLESGHDVIGMLSMWICAIGAISLLMGGIGIMNIMLLVVTERMHEIGVRKAVGATGRQILGQFILEAAVLSLLGGAIGIVLSLGVIGLLRLYTDLEPVISWSAVGVAAGISIAIGIIFGSVPAIKAARKDPIEALRHE
jgi:ABC-type antimicrobial peptide transport system permease subunit